MSQRHAVLATLFVLAAGVFAVTSDGQQSPAPAAPKPKPNFVSVVKLSHPLAYYRLEATSGSSAVGTSTYSSQGGVTSSDLGAPIGIEGNKCVLLDGKDGWITTTQTGGITTAGSMMAWVNLAALPSDAGRILYVGGESQSGNDFDVQFETDNILMFYTASGSHSSYTPDPKSLVGQWHMIVVTMNTITHHRVIYWDGQPVTLDQDAGTPNKTSPFSIGASTVFGGRHFVGSMDEVALWNRALSAAEVMAIYRSTKK